MKRFVFLVCLLLTASSCRGFGSRVGVVAPKDPATSAVVMDFGALELEPLSEGWHHYKFVRHKPMSLSVVSEDGRTVLRAQTNDTASMLFRHTDVPLMTHPFLTWEWRIDEAIDSPLDESTPAGDDHPARFFLELRDESGSDKKYLEIIFGNSLLAGDYKYLKQFPHYVARGGDDAVGDWHSEVVDLRAVYAKAFGSDAEGMRLTELAIFCDSDNTNTSSLAFFNDVYVAPESLLLKRQWQRVELDAQTRALTPQTIEATGYRVGSGSLHAFFDDDVLLKIHGELRGARGGVDLESYYLNEKIALVSVTQSLFDQTDSTKVTWSERNMLYFDEAGALHTVTDKDGNEMTGATAERARSAFLDDLEVESWPDRWRTP